MKKTHLIVLIILCLLIPLLGYAKTVIKTSIRTVINTPFANINGLVSYWTFDGKNILNGSVLDSSGNNHTGTLVSISTSTFYAAGKIGQGFNFDGINDQMTTNSDFIGTNPITVAAWINTNTIAANHFIVNNGRFFFRLASARFGLSSDNSTNALSAVNAISVNKWIYLVGTRDASGVTNLYMNGVLSGTANQSSGTPVSGTINVTVSSTAQFFSGIIDDVRIYNRVLSAVEVNQLYNNGLVTIKNNL